MTSGVDNFPILGQTTGTPVSKSPEAIPILQTNNDLDITKHFPFPTIREAQSQALITVVESAKNHKKFTLIEAPTGVGKSGIAMATASWAKTQILPAGDWQKGAYILSTQKTLTQQYVNDFSKDGLLELKGRSNYFCARYNTDCGTAAHLQEDDDTCAKTGGCPYAEAKKKFMYSPVGVTNFSYYLTETMYAGVLKNRNYLVLDECHNVENQLLGFTDTEFTPQRAAELEIELPILTPGVKGNTAEALKWFETVCTPVMAEYIASLRAAMDATEDRDERIAMSKKYTAWDNFKGRTDRFLQSSRHEDWICFSDINPKTGAGTKNLIIKPLTATMFSEELMFRKAENIVMMSATILDFKTFMRNLGIDAEKTNTMAVPSEFPIENRPIFYKPIGNMGFRTKNEALPKIAKAVLQLMQRYAGKKGIIHCVSYGNMKYIQEYLTANGQGHRLTTHNSLPGSREAAVAKHCESANDSVLLSPSMTEGLDLKEDLSRFQIIVKVPYLALDPYTKARMDRDPGWYVWSAALALVQATGRSVRSKTDKAETWILDEGFGSFLGRNEATLPKWWTDSIEFR
jgi:Rad3-related DNA helicase